MKMDDGIRLLEEKHVMHILDFIGSNPDCMKTEIYKAVSHNPRMPDKLNMLEREGLILQEKKDPRGTTTITLTEKGERIALLLEDIDCALRS